MAKKATGITPEDVKNVVEVPAPPITPVETVSKDPVGNPNENPTPAQIDPNTTVFFIYLLWKMDMLDRYGIKRALGVIKDKTPDDIVAYLLKEANKI